jgi:UDP-galactopyranose mutase
MKYDYLIVGAGFFGATFARLMTDAGKSCLVIDNRKHIGGNAYTEKKNGIDVHMYGPHIFHTNDDDIWAFVNRFTKFNNFILSPKAYANGRMYSLPFNMNTFYEVWGCTTPEQAKEIIDSQKFQGEPTNLEEQALSLVGKDIYELLIKGYTEKQWMKDCRELPAFIIKRLPLRFTYDNNYFNDKYQGIPVDGYTKMFENMLDGIQVNLMNNFFDDRNHLMTVANKVVFTGKIDEFFDYKYGELEYRTLEFEHQELNSENFQGAAQVNYPNKDVPWTRIIEHKHFNGAKTKTTVVTKETPAKYDKTKVPYYPVNDQKNDQIYRKYVEETEKYPNVIFGGRLAEYKYYDMHQIIGSAMKTVKSELNK